VLVAASALIESRHPAPLVQLRIFRSRTLAGADALTILIGTVAVGMPLVLTLYAQQVLGYSALKFGISSVVLALGATAGAIVGQAAVGKASFRPAAATGLALMAAGSLVLTQVSTRQLLPGHLRRAALVGLGIGLAFVTATVAALAGVADHEAGLASGLSNTALQPAQRSASPSSRPLPSPAPSTTWQRTKARTRPPCWPRATSPPSWPAPCWPGSAWRWRSCSPADRGSQRTSGQNRTRRPMPLPQETW
jgi:hypothetical protein